MGDLVPTAERWVHQLHLVVPNGRGGFGQRMGGRGDRRGARRVSAFLMGALGSSFDAKRWLPRQRNDEAVRGERDDDREDGE